MEREQQQKPDASLSVNGYDVTLYRRGRGLLIRVRQNDQELGFFGIAGTSPAAPLPPQPEHTPAPVPVAPVEQHSTIPTPPIPATPTPSPVTSEVRREPTQPVKIVGTVATIEGMGQTPTTGDPVFRFSVKTEQEEIKQIAAFRDIAKMLDAFHRSPDPNIKLIPGRHIDMMAFDHTAKTGSYYPSLVHYLNLPPIANPKRR